MEEFGIYIYIFIYIYIYIYNWAMSLMSRVFANGPGDRGSIPARVIPKIQKMVLDAALLSTQHYKVRIKGKVKRSREWSSTFPYTSMLKLLKRVNSAHSRLRSPTSYIYMYIYIYIYTRVQSHTCIH